MFYVYAIQSIATSRVYVGETHDFDTRLAEHNTGRVKSTRQNRPWKLIKLSPCENREAARWLEHQLKASRGKRLKWLKNE